MIPVTLYACLGIRDQRRPLPQEPPQGRIHETCCVVESDIARRPDRLVNDRMRGSAGVQNLIDGHAQQRLEPPIFEWALRQGPGNCAKRAEPAQCSHRDLPQKGAC
jgi:hypothetical protein